MNKYEQIIQSLKEKAEPLPAAWDAIPNADPSEADDDDVERPFRLPYSSDPRPMEPPWH